MPAQFDVWLLQAAMRRVSGSSTIRAFLLYDYSDANQGWGVADDGDAVVGVPAFVLAYWDAAINIGTVTTGGLALAEQPLAPFRPFRLPRGVDGPITFLSVSTLTAVFQLQLVLGVFPISLGQDGIV